MSEGGGWGVGVGVSFLILLLRAKRRSRCAVLRRTCPAWSRAKQVLWVCVQLEPQAYPFLPTWWCPRACTRPPTPRDTRLILYGMHKGSVFGVTVRDGLPSFGSLPSLAAANRRPSIVFCIMAV